MSVELWCFAWISPLARIKELPGEDLKKSSAREKYWHCLIPAEVVCSFHTAIDSTGLFFGLSMVDDGQKVGGKHATVEAILSSLQQQLAVISKSENRR